MPSKSNECHPSQQILHDLWNIMDTLYQKSIIVYIYIEKKSSFIHRLHKTPNSINKNQTTLLLLLWCGCCNLELQLSANHSHHYPCALCVVHAWLFLELPALAWSSDQWGSKKTIHLFQAYHKKQLPFHLITCFTSFGMCTSDVSCLFNCGFISFHGRFLKP